MGFNLESISMELEGDLDPAKFSGKDTTARAGFQEIRIKLKAKCDASEEQLDTWLEVVESRCPVGDNISNATPVKITLRP